MDTLRPPRPYVDEGDKRAIYDIREWFVLYAELQEGEQREEAEGLAASADRLLAKLTQITAYSDLYDREQAKLR